MQFFGLFSSPLVSRLAIAKQAFDYTENVLHLCTDRGFLFLPALHLRPSLQRTLLKLGWLAVNFITDFLALIVADNGVLSLIRTEIPGISVDAGVLSMKRLRRYRYIVHVCCRCFQVVNQSAVTIRTNMRLVAKVPGIAMIFPSREVVSFLMKKLLV